MGRSSSIEKLNGQIDMLTNHDFVEKKIITKKVDRTKPRKEIVEEPTVVEDDLMSDLVSDDENTKVFGQKEEKEEVTEDVVDVEPEPEAEPVIYQTKEINTEEFKKLKSFNSDNNFFRDIILPIILVILIIIFILLIILI